MSLFSSSSSHLKSKLRNLFTKTKTLTLDTYNLSLVLIKNPPKSLPCTRSLLLQQAQRNRNTVASSILQIDKEINLLRYYGVNKYMKQQFLLGINGPNNNKFGANAIRNDGTSSSSDYYYNDVREGWNRFLYGTKAQSERNAGGGSSGDEGEVKIPETNQEDDTNTSRTTQPTTEKKARIAFMITASQRYELTIRLGYDTSHIRRLTPLEALLILENDVHPENTTEVQRLVKENEELEQLEAEETQRQFLQEQEERQKRERLLLLEEIRRMQLAEKKESNSILDVEEVTLSDNGDEQFPTGEEGTEAPMGQGTGAVDRNGSLSSSSSSSSLELSSSLSPSLTELTSQSSTEPTEWTISEGKERPMTQVDEYKREMSVKNDNNTFRHSFEEGEYGDNNTKILPDNVDKTPNKEGGTEWFEVIETHSVDGTSDVVALYRTKEEAKDCVEWKEKKAVRGRKSSATPIMTTADDDDHEKQPPLITYAIRRKVH